jgi:phospholipase A1
MRTTTFIFMLFYSAAVFAGSLEPAIVVSSEKAEAAAPDKTATADYESLDSLFALYQPYLGNITAYKPMYFLVGADPKNSKFQISFKYRFLNPDGSLAVRHPWVKGFHFAYTQTSFWNLKSASAPFEDTSYKPEFFFQSANIEAGLSGTKRLFLQAGFQHESNGRGAEYSRSTNFLYVKPIFIVFNEKNRFGLQVAPRIWTYVANAEDTNADLADYRGYFDLELKFGKADSFVLCTLLGWANEGGSIEMDLTYPLHQFSNNVQVYLQTQYVSSLAESLLHYQERTEAFRFGFAIVR